MANKKISEFPVTTSLAGDDAFLMNHLGSTSTVAFSSLSAAVTNNSIKLPSVATNGQVLTYNGSTTTWVASAVPKELPSTALSGQVLSYDGSTSTWIASTPSAPGIAKAWVCFNGIRTGNGVVSIYSSFNVSSVTKTEQACYTINFINAMADTNYAFAGSCRGDSNEHTPSVSRRAITTTPVHTTTQLYIMCGEADNTVDVDYVSVIVFGN